MINRRIVLVHNPRSSRAKGVYKKVILPIKNAHLPADKYVEYIVTPIGPNNNAKLLSRKLADRDLVIVAGGDGTASIAANAILQTNFDGIQLAVFGFGNFNDIATTFPAGKLGIKKLLDGNYKTRRLYPLEIKMDNRRFRYGVLYASFGLLAGAANQFENRKHRQSLRHGGANLLYSLLMLLPYYIRNKKRHFLPDYRLNDETTIYSKTTDYMAVNSPVVAKMFRTGQILYNKSDFLRVQLKVSHFWRSVPFVVRSLTGSMPGILTERDDLWFEQPAKVAVQIDGEYEEFLNIEKITVKKSDKHLSMVV